MYFVYVIVQPQFVIICCTQTGMSPLDPDFLSFQMMFLSQFIDTGRVCLIYWLFLLLLLLLLLFCWYCCRCCCFLARFSFSALTDALPSCTIRPAYKLIRYTMIAINLLLTLLLLMLLLYLQLVRVAAEYQLV